MYIGFGENLGQLLLPNVFFCFIVISLDVPMTYYQGSN